MLTVLCALIAVKSAIAIEREMTLRATWRAIVQVESGGNRHAIGDGGKAVGVGQIHPCVVRDANRVFGYRKFRLSDRADPVKSYEIFRTYCRLYENHGTPEMWARLWNSGPNWREKMAQTDGYWWKVRARM
jgi:soluble lytic murein transglycosylase-like protein